MRAAEEDEVAAVGGTAVRPGGDVMRIAPVRGPAPPLDDATAVPDGEGASLRGGSGASPLMKPTLGGQARDPALTSPVLAVELACTVSTTLRC